MKRFNTRAPGVSTSSATAWLKTIRYPLVHFYLSTMVQDNGSRRWFKTMVQDKGSRQRFKTIVQDNGSRQWFKTMVQDVIPSLRTCLLVSRRWFKMMVQDDDSRRWLKTMVQQVIPSLCTPTCLLMYTFCPSCPGSSYIIAICIAEQSYLRQQNPVCTNLNC